MLELETMTGARHLQLDAATPMPPIRPVRARRRRWLAIALAGAGTAVIAAAALWWTKPWQPTANSPAGGSSDTLTTAAPAGPLPALPPPDLLRPLTPEDAVALNAERPLVKRPDSPAAAFRLSGDAINKLRAVDCMTQAVYYEAASEGVEGGRAVAQVVLNRMRHPGYPNSVCGVVYQGSPRPTGCQFTFTCDGSLARIPAGYLWTRSRLIASEALAGRVFAPVGHATHYHANYVVPYWADSLDKVAVIGRHIFYRLRGTNGSGAAFSQRYAGAEPLPPPPPSATDIVEQGLDSLAPPVAIDPNLPPAAKVAEDQVKQLEVAPKPAAEQSTLQADLARGQLILGEPGTAASSPKKKSAAAAPDCGSGGVTRVKAVGANDLSAVVSKTSC
ncbi:cell wall hydrolase [Sphingomonas ginsengisoli (ex An et al. 2013)]|nr:cell wall hydrolase [Sphingomonas ginsengisoli An et al. 2013]